MRKTIYISERRSKIIADFINSVPAKDVSYEAVKLMEDGMKWRASGNDVDKRSLETKSSGEVLLRQVPVPQMEKEQTSRADFSGIKLERKRLEKGDLEQKFNNL